MVTFFAVVALVAGILILVISSCIGDSNSTIAGMFGGLFVFLGLFAIINIISPSPEPIDVYRGNTELKITGTYKDSIFIPTDSTVIFKSSYEPKY